MSEPEAELFRRLAPETMIVETVLRPMPLEPIAGRRVFYVTTAPETHEQVRGLRDSGATVSPASTPRCVALPALRKNCRPCWAGSSNAISSFSTAEV